ncbi:hypothetical protein [Serinicoccus sediminis]|uniref:hypothetical protein n=1 Tax=Serinicoccus sediminis TaxID=2306021 RepID=UPI0010213D72|nr:hypothetical protein [Serinicoccus sediminis]
MSETTLPAHIGWGYVRGRVIASVADTAEDADEYPQARPLAGKVFFTDDVDVSFGSPDQAGTTGYADIVYHDVIEASLSSSGRILDGEGRQGIWLPEGSWAVRVEPASNGNEPKRKPLEGRLTIGPEHTLETPQQLSRAFPYTAPAGATVQTLVVPDDGVPGQLLTRDVAGELAWVDPVQAGATYDDSGVIARLDALEGEPAPDLSGYAQTSSLATVATTGAYGDLTGKPTIPSTPGEVGAQPAGSYATLVGGVIPSSQIPALALTSTNVVASQAAMLALSNVQTGDIAVRTDGAGTFILSGANPAQIGSWTLLSSPTDAVTSVNGQTGAITLSAANVGAAPTTRTITAGTGLSGGGDLSANRSLSVNYGTTAGTAAQGNDSRLQAAATAVQPADATLLQPTILAAGATPPSDGIWLRERA